MQAKIRAGDLLQKHHGDSFRSWRHTMSTAALKVEDTKEGAGAAAAKGDAVEVHYTGWLTQRTHPAQCRADFRGRAAQD